MFLPGATYGVARADINQHRPLPETFSTVLQGGSAGAYGEVERQVRIFMQDERQRVHGCARAVHFEDIREKGESGHGKLTFCLRLNR